MVEDAIKTVVSEVVRQVLREELQALRQPPPAEQNLLSLRKASELFGISASTLKAWLRSGELTRFGKGRIVRISKAQLLEQLEPKPAKRLDSHAMEQLAAKHLQRRTT